MKMMRVMFRGWGFIIYPSPGSLLSNIWWIIVLQKNFICMQDALNLFQVREAISNVGC